mgnify:CR=1 FL=1
MFDFKLNRFVSSYRITLEQIDLHLLHRIEMRRGALAASHFHIKQVKTTVIGRTRILIPKLITGIILKIKEIFFAYFQ